MQNLTHHHRHSHDAPSGDAERGACRHAHDHAERGPVALAEAEKICGDKGLRLTDIRRNVLEALYATHRPLGAYDVIERLADKGLKRLAPVTIYRALEFLMENGFAHKLASRNAFVACPFHHRPDEVVVFLICEECGGVDETVSDDLTAALGAIVQREGFKQQSRVIEIVGSCSHCLKSSPE